MVEKWCKMEVYGEKWGTPMNTVLVYSFIPFSNNSYPKVAENFNVYAVLKNKAIPSYRCFFRASIH